MNAPLDGKVAIVTGASRGLGRSMASQLSAAGASLVVASRSTVDLKSFVTETEALGRRALAVPCDVSDEDSVQAMVAAAVQEFGRLDIVVNNAGVVYTSPLLDQTSDAWDRVIDTNLRGVYLVTRAAGPHLIAQGSGKVINIASNFALMGVSQHTAYTSSKAAIIAFTQSLAVEWARHNIQVNALAPGYFETDINTELRANAAVHTVLRRIPARRMGRAEELGPWVQLLAGPASDFMTGSTIVIDGGHSVQ
ncbi:SDR family NAD(P)-dependent oxidoreductase [Streptomyces sp. NPDC090088]|uniref:SDR family NAD(P)-dependent oxidoreductase n=1 Tax=Streptomyces sp. NPDC090088 TaxID=3365944 RepID=UPI003809DB67